MATYISLPALDLKAQRQQYNNKLNLAHTKRRFLQLRRKRPTVPYLRSGCSSEFHNMATYFNDNHEPYYSLEQDAPFLAFGNPVYHTGTTYYPPQQSNIASDETTPEIVGPLTPPPRFSNSDSGYEEVHDNSEEIRAHQGCDMYEHNPVLPFLNSLPPGYNQYPYNNCGVTPQIPVVGHPAPMYYPSQPSYNPDLVVLQHPLEPVHLQFSYEDHLRQKHSMFSFIQRIPFGRRCNALKGPKVDIKDEQSAKKYDESDDTVDLGRIRLGQHNGPAWIDDDLQVQIASGQKKEPALWHQVPKKLLVLFCGRDTVCRFLRTVGRGEQGNPIKQELRVPSASAFHVGLKIMFTWMRRACLPPYMADLHEMAVPENTFAAIALARTLRTFRLYHDAQRVEKAIAANHFKRPLTIIIVKQIWTLLPKECKFTYRMIDNLRGQIYAVQAGDTYVAEFNHEEMDKLLAAYPDLWRRVYVQGENEKYKPVTHARWMQLHGENHAVGPTWMPHMSQPHEAEEVKPFGVLTEGSTRPDVKLEKERRKSI